MACSDIKHHLQKRVCTMNSLNIKDDKTERWHGRPQKFLDAVRTPIAEEINKLTAGWVLELLHRSNNELSPDLKEPILNILSECPGFSPSDDGRYHYQFICQLEFLCKATRDAYALKEIS